MLSIDPHSVKWYEKHGRAYYQKNKERIKKAQVEYRERQKFIPLVECGYQRTLVRRIINAVAVLEGCSICGYKQYSSAMDWHHINPGEKDFCLGKGGLTGKSWEDILQEMDKCCVLCSNCHRAVTAKQLELAQ